jgi:hypothetical protein
MYQYLLPVIWLKVDTNLPRSNNVFLTMYISKSTLTHKHKSAFNVQAEGGVKICQDMQKQRQHTSRAQNASEKEPHPWIP